MANERQWCFTWLANNPKVAGRSKAALLKEAMWPAGSIIKVAFLDGDKSVQARVRTEALRWTQAGDGPANLTLSFIDDIEAADIRISFRYAGSWSVLGTTCRHLPLRLSEGAAGDYRPTMNFGWLTPATSDEELRRVVLHEFGHALGLIHEHLSPNVHIQWNKPAVYAELKKPPNQWDQQTIDVNMFDAFAAQEINATQFDPQSIMLYPIPARWTLDGFSTELNTKLSPQDRALIQQQYP